MRLIKSGYGIFAVPKALYDVAIPVCFFICSFVRLIKSGYGIFAVPKALYDLIQGGAHHRRLILAEE